VSTSIEKVRACLQSMKPGIDVDTIADDMPLLENRIITSLDVVDLLVHLENLTGKAIRREKLVPGSFRDIATIASVFVDAEAAS
jgi:acyl carrier protein